MPRTVAVCALTLAGLVSYACSLIAPDESEYVGGNSALDGGPNGGSGGGANGGTAGLGGDGGTAGVGGMPAGGSAGLGGNGGAAGQGTGGVPCTDGQYELVPQPVALHFVLDRTNSMQDDWSTMRQGVSQYINGASGAAGLQYFPPTTTFGGCTGNGYDKPLIPIASVLVNGNAIQSSLSSTNTTTAIQQSQLLGVLTGGLQYATSYAAQNPDQQVALVLITDWTGKTDSCTDEVTPLSALAETAATADPPVRTYVLKFDDANDPVLDAIAQAGGTLSATDVFTDNHVQNALSEAAVSCRFDFPAIDQYGTLTITVSGSALNGAQVAGPKACTDFGFYVSGNPPKAIELCPQSCALLQMVPSTLVLETACP